MRKAKSMLVIALVMSVLLSVFTSVSAQELITANVEEAVQFEKNCVIKIDDKGAITISDEKYNSKDDSLFEITQYRDNLYTINDQKKLPYNKIVMVSKNLFQPTEEIKIASGKYSTIKEIPNYNLIPKHMMEKVEKFLIGKNLNDDASLSLYSPDFIVSSGTQGKGTNYYYYWGTGGYYYKHEDLWANNWTSNISQRGVDEDDWDYYCHQVFSNTVKTAIGAIVATIPFYEGAKTVAEILFVPDMIPGSSFQNTHSMQQVEDKHIQYESIRYPGNNMCLKIRVERSDTDYCQTTCVDGVFDTEIETGNVWQAPNFWNGSTLCYQYRDATLVYREEVYRYKKLNFTFSSY